MSSKRFSAETISTKFDLFDGKVPIVLGTVGHRDLGTSAGEIVAAVRKECRQLRRKYRNSPFIILSGLAEGADRIISKIALDELGAKLIVILPFPATDFCEDFTTQTSREEFSALYDQAAAVHVMSQPDHANWRQTGSERNEQYARVGALIAEQSQVLIALWDGKPARGLGGTAEVVEWFNQGYAPHEFSAYDGSISLFDPPQPGLFIRIDPLTAKRTNKGNDSNGGNTFYATRVRIDDILRRTESYNRDVRRRAARHINKTSLVPAAVLAQTHLLEAHNAFRAADALSVYYGQRVRLANWVFYALALTTVFAFGLVDAKPLASWSFLGVMGILTLVWLYTKNLSLDAKYLEYRSFAEAMRILFFWRMLGIQRQVWLSYLSKHGTVVGWLRHAVRAIEFTQDQQLPSAIPTRLDRRALYKTVTDHWLRRQIEYFKSAAGRHKRRYIYGTWIVWTSVALTFATSIALAILTLNYANGFHAWRYDRLVALPFGNARIGEIIQQLQIAVSLSAALGIAARSFLIRSADLELAKQYTSAFELFKVAEQATYRIDKENQEMEYGHIFERLGREALLEQAEWLWIRHSRPFEVPT